MEITNFARAAIAATLLTAGSSAHAQSNDVVVDGKGETPYAIDARNAVVRSGAGLCWRTGYWSPAAAGTAMAGQFPAGCQCDGDIVPREKCTAPAAAAAPAPAPAAAPAPAPAPAAPTRITLSSKALFGFDKATLTPEGRAAIDREVIARLPEVGTLTLVTVSGHTDRLGAQAYNQALSERRANAVKAYLVQKGVSADLIDTIGYGKTQPVPGVRCEDSMGRTKLIACLEPHRRVEVELRGTPK